MERGDKSSYRRNEESRTTAGGRKARNGKSVSNGYTDRTNDGYNKRKTDRVNGVHKTKNMDRADHGYSKDHRVQADQTAAAENVKKKSKCPVSKRCGGCAYLDIPYEEQLKKKEDYVRRMTGGSRKVHPVAGMQDPYHYRCKVTATFQQHRDGRIVSGIYEEGTHHVVPVTSCLIEDEKADEIIGTIRHLIPSFRIRVYDEDTGFGLLRHVLIRAGRQSGQILVVLVVASPVFPSKNNFVRALRQKHPEITSVVLNINDRRTSMVLGTRNITIYGKGYIEDTLCGKTFRISPTSFFQVNPVQTEALYAKAIELAGLTGEETVFDAYSGIGTIGIIAASRARQVISVELNKDAVRDAVINASMNKVENIQFYQADAGDFLEQMAASGEKADVIFMDPPRTGSTEKFMRAAAAIRPSRIVYVSCEPETLGRDLTFFRKLGYRAGDICPLDMFPFTRNVETVCLLSKLHEAKHHINVKVDMDELDLTSAEAKATYKEIEEWVQENYGFHVTNLNIAQVKQKHGIIERENYNKPKSENSRQPGCPEEKVKAIEAAMRHFQMI